MNRVEAAGVVLVGGRSQRMGRPKADLPWHGSTLLRRTVGVLGRAVAGPRVVVAAPGQALPALPADVEVVADPVTGRGPLQGLAVGLGAVAERAEVAFVCATDLPFLHPDFVAAVLDGFAARPDVDVVLPVAAGYRQPLAAGYRTALVGLVTERIAAGLPRLGELFEHCPTLRLDEARLPALASLTNVNTPQQYTDALARPLPRVRVDGRVTAAATLGAVLPRGVSTVLLNGTPTAADRLLPLVDGDEVRVRSDTGSA